MNFEVQELEYCKVAVHAEIDSERIHEKRIEVLSEFKKLPVNGFRPGKASLEAIKFRYKNQIEARLREALAEDAFHGALNEKNLKPLGQPEFSSLTLQDSGFSCDFTLHTKPNVDLAEYKEFSLPKPVTGITASDFAESLLQELRERNGETLPFGDDDFVQKGDNVIVDYTGTIDGAIRPELTAKKEVISIGNSPFTAFDDNLLGMKLGDEREFDIAAPENAAKEYVGKTITFKVSLAMGSKTKPAALDDELAKRLSFESLDALRDHVNGIATGRVDQHEKANLSQQVAARLVEKHEFKVPAWLVTAEAQMNAKRGKLNWEELTDERKEELLSAAEKSIRLSLVLEKIREVEPEAQLSDEELQNHLRSELVKITKSSNPSDVEKSLQHLSQTGMLPMLVGKIRDEFTLNFLVGTCKVVE